MDVGDAVVAVGDAGGDGGSLTAASGTVTALRQQIDISEDGRHGARTLRRLIEVDSDIIPGDSGGALLEADGDVVGMNVAASSGGSNQIDGYVIPIRRVLKVVDKVLAGDDTGSVTLGYSAFLGIGTVDHGAGAATVGNTVADGPASAAGIVAGDTVTSLGGVRVSTPVQLRRAVAAHDPGDPVTVTWTDASGTSHSASATLGRAPLA